MGPPRKVYAVQETIRGNVTFMIQRGDSGIDFVEPERCDIVDEEVEYRMEEPQIQESPFALYFNNGECSLLIQAIDALQHESYAHANLKDLSELRGRLERLKG